MSNSLLETGIGRRILYVEDIGSKDAKVQEYQNALDEIMHKIGSLISSEEYDSLESGINLLRGADTAVAFRIGIADGMQLQQEINALAAPRRETPAV